MNNENKPIKQINRIAKPIQLDSNGEKVQDDNKTAVSIASEASIINTPKPQTKRKLPSTESKFITIIIMLMAANLIALLCLLFIKTPNKENPKYNDITTTTQNINYRFNKVTIADAIISTPGVYQVNNFNIITSLNVEMLDIIINNKHITNSNYLINEVATVDDLLVITTKNNIERTTNLYAVDTSGTIVYHLFNIDDYGLLLEDNNAVNYNIEFINIYTTRVNGNKIYYSNQIGNNSSANICDEDDMFKKSITTDKPVIAHYQLKYIGDHQFTLSKPYHEVSLEEYKKLSNICK